MVSAGSAVTVTAVTSLATSAAYVVSAPLNGGLSATGSSFSSVSDSPLSAASDELARVTVTSYVLVVSPSWAVTAMLTTVSPTASGTTPSRSGCPSTWIPYVDVVSASSAVTVTAVTSLATVAA